MRRAEGTRLVQPGEQIPLGTPNSSLASTYREIIKKLDSGYSVLHKVGNKSMDIELKEEAQTEYKETS